MSATIPVPVDADLLESAKSAGAVAGRSAAQQISHWARIGRALENAADIRAGRRTTVSRADARRELDLGLSEDQIRAEYQAAKSADDGERVTLSDLLAELADARAVDTAWEDAQDVAAFDAAMAEEGENIPWAQVEAAEVRRAAQMEAFAKLRELDEALEERGDGDGAEHA